MHIMNNHSRARPGRRIRSRLVPALAATLLICQAAPSFGAEPKPPTAAAAKGGSSADGEAFDQAVVSRVTRQCMACHTFEKGEAHSTGPNLHTVFGRAAGKVKGFNFSADLKGAKFKWNEETLNRFLQNPRAVFPNTAMAYGGMESASERAALIGYLRALPKN